jgi:LuxR family transcriptional regulator, maltose regulon positive regulatory protein
MTIPLQRTKLFAPAARTRLVERPRLLEQLGEVLLPGCKAALLSGPAGAGKTTLVQQWLSDRRPAPSGWLSLDARDNQPQHFFRYLIAALRNLAPGAGDESMELLRLPGVDLDEVVISLTNDLLAVDETFVLVLDDFHAITNPTLIGALDHLLDAQPPQMRLILISRQDPPMQLSRRRARSELVEIRQDDLRFTLPEAVAFLNQTMSLHLSVGQVERLETRTEGWVAGLQMAALSLQYAPDTDIFIRDFSGSHRFILDYLLEEVFSHQSAQVQQFLLETSVLERMCAGLCSALTGADLRESQALLDELSNANLFVFSLDNERRWYRYHHLFKDLLLARLQWELPGRADELRRKASDWFESNGEAQMAVDYALKASEIDLAADLIERHVAERWQMADMEFMQLLKRLPPEMIFDRPGLSLHSAWMCVINGQIMQMPPFLAAAEQALSHPGRVPEPGDAVYRGFITILRAYLADHEDQPVTLDKSLANAYSAIPESSTGMRNSLAIVLGTLYYMNGEFSLAMQYYQDAMQRDKRVNSTNAVPIAVLRMVWVLKKQGRLREAYDLITENERYIRERGVRQFFISGVLYLLLADLLLEWNRLDEAQNQLQEAMRLLEDWPSSQSQIHSYCVCVCLKIAQGDLPAARAALLRAQELRESSDTHPEFINILTRAQMQLWSAEQNQPALESYVRATTPLVESKFHFRYEYRLIELARAHIVLGRDDEAAALLERLDQAAAGRNGSRIMILALLSAARHADPHLADIALDEALRLAHSEGNLRTFVEIGDPLRPALVAWLHNHPETGPLRAYGQQILQAFERPAEAASQQASTGKLDEPLSPREQEVLRLVGEGLTNQQIAARLVISVRTVKKHIENIHGKLGVQNRTQAAARARNLGLLDS